MENDEIVWVKQNAILISQTALPLWIINTVARVCYNSNMPEDFGKQTEFVKALIRREHESPLEFVDFIWGITTSRAIANELVRHRIASYMQESTRYVGYQQIKMIEPVNSEPGMYNKYEVGEAAKQAFIHYRALVQNGVSKQNARDVLPIGMATTIYCKMNLREFRHFLSLRIAKPAHPMMRDLAKKMVKAVRNSMPWEYSEAMLYGLELDC